MFLPSLFSRISSSSSSLSLFALFYLAHFDKKNHAYRKRKNRRILEKSALCHVAKDQLCFCRVYLAAYRRRRRLCLSLFALFYLAHFVWQIVKGAGVKRDICRQNSLGSSSREITCIYEQHILQMAST